MSQMTSEVPRKQILIKSGKVWQIARRLTALGFNRSSDGRYVNSSSEANIRDITWTQDRIEDDFVWLVVTPRKPFASATAAMQWFAQRRQANLERNLRVATAYWLQIQPYIKSRRLRDVELCVATDAYRRLRKAAACATEWNNTAEGRRFSVPVEAFPDFAKDRFTEPQELCQGENLKALDLAVIAAPLMAKRTVELSLSETIVTAHKLLLAAEQYVKALPEPKREGGGTMEAFDKAFGTVTFAEIKASNRKDSGQLPLLPAMGQKRKNISEQEQRERPLSVAAIREAVRRYLVEHTPCLTGEEYERDQEQTARLAKEGKLQRLGSGETRTYQEWQSDNKKAIDDCTENSRISQQALCNLRWERFLRTLETRQRSAVTRQKKRRKAKEKIPSSAGSSPVTAGKPEKRKK